MKKFLEILKKIYIKFKDTSGEINLSYGKSVFSVSEVQRILGIGRRQAYSLVNSGQFRIKRVGRTILIPKKSFDDWLYSNDKKIDL